MQGDDARHEVTGAVRRSPAGSTVAGVWRPQKGVDLGRGLLRRDAAAEAPAAALGVIGLYGVIAFLVVRRAGEMAIRSALGARPGDLLRHVLATGGWVVAVGLGSGTALALLVMRVFAQIATGVATADPVVWASVPLLLVVVCAVAFVVPALRIVRLDVPRALQVH